MCGGCFGLVTNHNDLRAAFQLAVPGTEIDALREKLSLTRFPDELEDAGWAYGVPLSDLKRLVQRWKDGYDWRRHEKEINHLPMFTRDIEVDGHGSLNIHYVHQKSVVEGAIPLAFVHGWPGHFLEVKKILGLLTESSPDHPSFHVVALSLPGYGFSEAPKTKKFTSERCAEVCNKLMIALGYNEYVAQGGDWGYYITRRMATNYGGKHVKAWHTNMPRGTAPTFTNDPVGFLSWQLHTLTPVEKAGFERTKWFQTHGRGYFHEQATQPQTMAYSLADSPAGLLAWIYEKLVNWTDKYPWTDDEVLDWVSVYWFSRAGPAASIRLYYEVTQNEPDRDGWPAAKIPTGTSHFPQEIKVDPKAWTRQIGKVVFESEHDSGGHFAAYEKPAELASDVRKMFGKGGPAFGVVPGKDGY